MRVYVAFEGKSSNTVFLPLSDAFQCRILLSLWHVRRGWLKDLLKHCHNFDVQREMFKHLGRILYCTRNASSTADAVEEFLQIYIDQSEFVEYFRNKWLPKIGTILPSFCLMHMLRKICKSCKTDFDMIMLYCRIVGELCEDSPCGGARKLRFNRILSHTIKIESPRIAARKITPKNRLLDSCINNPIPFILLVRHIHSRNGIFRKFKGQIQFNQPMVSSRTHSRHGRIARRGKSPVRQNCFSGR